MCCRRPSVAVLSGAVLSAAVRAQTSSSAAAAVAPPLFNAIPHWCALCCEPISSWTEHVGKREHIALGMVFEAVVASPRRWCADELWRDAEAYLAPQCEAHYRGGGGACAPWRTGPADRFRQRHHLPAHTHVPCDDSTWHDMLHWYDRHDTALGRRDAIHGCLRHWADSGVFAPMTTPSYFSAAAFHGTMVLFKELFPPLAKVFPNAAAKDISAITQTVSTAFHLETLFDLCGMGALVPPELLDTRQLFLSSSPPPPRHDSATTSTRPDLHPTRCGNTNSRAETAASGRSFVDDGTVTFKANFVRAVLGLMRWAVEPDALQTDFLLPTDDDADQALSDFPPRVALSSHAAAAVTDRMCSSRWSEAACSADAVLAAHTSQLIVTELINSRLAEYVSRVEPVVRERDVLHGGGALTRMRAECHRAGLSAVSPVPPPGHIGTLAYLSNDIVCALNLTK